MKILFRFVETSKFFAFDISIFPVFVYIHMSDVDILLIVMTSDTVSLKTGKSILCDSNTQQNY